MPRGVRSVRRPRHSFRAACGAAVVGGAALLAGCDGSPPAPVVLDSDGEAFVPVDALEPQQLTGAWSSPGGRCAEPDFTIAEDDSSAERGLAVRAEFNGWTRTGRLRLEAGPDIRFVDPERILPVSLQAGGLLIDAPSDGLAVLGSRNIFEGGVTFMKCAPQADAAPTGGAE